MRRRLLLALYIYENSFQLLVRWANVRTGWIIFRSNALWSLLRKDCSFGRVHIETLFLSVFMPTVMFPSPVSDQTEDQMCVVSKRPSDTFNVNIFATCQMTSNASGQNFINMYFLCCKLAIKGDGEKKSLTEKFKPCLRSTFVPTASHGVKGTRMSDCLFDVKGISSHRDYIRPVVF